MACFIGMYVETTSKIIEYCLSTAEAGAAGSVQKLPGTLDPLRRVDASCKWHVSCDHTSPLAGSDVFASVSAEATAKYRVWDGGMAIADLVSGFGVVGFFLKIY